jgi:hypothetical protein
MGAVLSQLDDDQVEHPVGYYSRKLAAPEKKWDIWELELAAMVWATTVCRHYLRGVHFELITDSKVVAMMIKKDVPKRRENLLVRLFEYDFTVTHRKGEINRNADFFSRWAAYKNWQDETNLAQCYSDKFVNKQGPSALETWAMLRVFAGAIQTTSPQVAAAAQPVSAADSPMDESKADSDFTITRKLFVEEQRKDPKLKLIIAELEKRLGKGEAISQLANKYRCQAR